MKSLKGLAIFAMLAMVIGGLLMAGTPEAHATGTAYYVALNGSDSWSGTLDAPNSGGTDGPFATIDHARSVVRSQIAGGMTSDITVYVRGGDYYLTGAVTFNEHDSGNSGYQVIYRNYPGEHPVLIDGAPVTGWQPYSGNIYKTNVGTSWKFYSLFENGTPGVVARTPNAGYNLTSAEVPGASYTAFIVNSGDIPAIADKADLRVSIWPGGPYGFWNWAENLIGVQSVDYTSNKVTLGGSAFYQIGAGSRYYARGALELLDQPGEFYLNSATGDLYYWPRTSGDIDDQTILAPKSQRMINFKGTAAGVNVENITFDGFELWGADSGLSTSAVYDNPVILLNRANYITIKNCYIHDVGVTAIEMYAHAWHNTIYGNKIERTGLGGIQIEAGGTIASSDIGFNSVISNDISNVGQVIGHGTGITVGQSADNTIQYNRVHSVPRFGISIGSPIPPNIVGKVLGGVTVTWENVADYIFTKRNVVQYNEVFDAMTDSQDGAPIYFYGANSEGDPADGNLIDSNAVHNSNVNMSYGFSIYLDDDSDYNTISNNVVYDMQTNGNGGPGELEGNIVLKGIGSKLENNFFINSTPTKGAVYAINSQSYPANNLWIAMDQIGSHNVYYNSLAPDGTFYAGTYQDGRFAQSDYNTMYDSGGQYGVNFANLSASLNEWQAMDKHKYDNYSKTADPLFLDPANKDFRFRYDSPVYAVSTQPIDFKQIGLKSDFPYSEVSDPLDRLFVNTGTTNSGESTVKLSQGATTQLAVSARTENGLLITDLAASGATVTFSASNITGTNVAAVSGSGLVTANNTGLAKITATVVKGAQTKSIDLYVAVNDTVDTLTLKSGSGILTTGMTQQLHAEGTSALGLQLDLTDAVTYSSGNTAVATVDGNGLVTAVSDGSATITATVAGKTSSVALSVLDPGDYLKSIAVAVDNQVLTVNGTANVTVTGTSDAGTAINLTGAAITYALDPTGVATVDNNNSAATTITATGEGRAALTATVTLNGLTQSASVPIISYADTTTSVPSPWQVTNFDFNNGTFNLGFVKVDSTGDLYRIETNGANVWGNADSTTFMYQEATHDPDTSSLSVSARVASLERITSSTAAGVMIKDANTKNSKEVDFRIQPDGSAVFVYRTADGGASNYIGGATPGINGEVKLTRMGDVIIGYYKTAGSTEWQEAAHITVPMDGDVFAGVLTFSGDVLPTSAIVDSISISTGGLVLDSVGLSAIDPNITMGTTEQAITTGYSNGYGSTMSLSGASIQYSSSNTSVATVDSSGIITGVATGTATITADVTLNGITKSDTMEVTVGGWQMIGASLTHTDTSVALNGTVQGNVQAVLPGGSLDTLPGTATVTWSSSVTQVATVASNGVITGAGYGVAAITATVVYSGNTYTSTVMVIVNSAALYSEGWESGLDARWTLQGSPSIVSNVSRSGTHSMHIGNDYDEVNDTTTISQIDGVQEFWMYDNAASPKDAFVNSDWVGTGVGNVYSAANYFSKNFILSQTAQLSSGGRTAGWHQIVYDYSTVPGQLDIYVDGDPINHLTSLNSHTMIGVGDYLSNGVASNSYFDDIAVYSTSSGTAVPVTGVSLNKSTDTINVGQTDALIATVTPSNATNQSVGWSSSDTAVATVDASGTVTAVSAGSADITVTTGDGSYTADCSVTVVANEVIVDNTDAAVVGGWTSATTQANYYGTDYLIDNQGSGDTVTWTPDIPAAGNYQVYYWLPNGNGSMASNAHYNVHYNGGSHTHYVGETSTGGQWKLLGTYNFAAGTAGYVQLNNSVNNNYVIADAVKFVRVP